MRAAAAFDQLCTCLARFQVCLGFGVQIPNGCGSFLGAVQLILYAIYRNSGGNKKAVAERGGNKQQHADGDVEMASGADAKGSSSKVADDDVDGAARKEDRLV